jgi:hypothetical protein
MHRPLRTSFALLVAFALALPALAAPCVGAGMAGSEAAMAESCPLMQAMATKQRCPVTAGRADTGLGWSRALPDCCVVSGDEPATTPGAVLTIHPERGLQLADGPRLSTAPAPACRPAPAPSPPGGVSTPLFTLHASLLI